MKFTILSTLLVCSTLTFAKDLSKKSRFPASEKFKVHACEYVAKEKAIPVLKFFSEFDDQSQISVDDKIKVLPKVISPDKKRKYDVLELTGSVYKADYRLKFTFAQISGECVLMGYEVLDLSSL